MAEIDPDYMAAEPEERPRDPKIDEAREVVLRLVEQDRSRVFYERQIAVLLEREFFHWISARAVIELAGEGKVGSEIRGLRGAGGASIRLVWNRRNRYPRRAASEVQSLVERFSVTGFGRALGRQGELMFDAALARIGFRPVDKNTRTYGENAWTETAHTLDRVYVGDEVAYGAEIKNTLDYIPREEMQLKMRMCEALGLVPLFIVRSAPKSYIYEVYRRGGVTLVFDEQFYPFGQEEFAERVRGKLGLPVACRAAVPDGHVDRLWKVHRRLRGEEV